MRFVIEEQTLLPGIERNGGEDRRSLSLRGVDGLKEQLMRFYARPQIEGLCVGREVEIHVEKFYEAKWKQGWMIIKGEIIKVGEMREASKK